MNIPKEFEDVFQGVELTEDEIRTLNWIVGWERRTVENLRSAIQKVQTTALSTLRAENEKLREKIEDARLEGYAKGLGEMSEENEKLRVELEQAKRERDAAVGCCSGYCASCLFVKDCAKHDMNDAAPTRWYYGDCEDWEWSGQKKED